MDTLVQQLDSNESLLLMYAADELPAEDRLEVTQMLDSDAGMRAELAAVQNGLARVYDSLGELDSMTRLPMTASSAVRRLGPALATLEARRATAPLPAAARRGLAYPWWFYPSASVAAIAIAAVVWWGVRSEDSTPAGTGDSTVAQRDPDRSDFRNSEVPGIDPTDSAIADAETQASALSRRGDVQSVTSSIFMTDTAD